MKKRFYLLIFCAALGACATVPDLIPVEEPTVVPGGILIGQPTLEGRWVIADDRGDQYCITIQEGRISVLNDGCLTNGLGFAARITEAPEAAVAGAMVVVTATYNPRIFDDTLERLTFVGSRQQDGTYIGTVTTEETTVEVIGPDEFVTETSDERFAVLSRE
jgi:hypothetical protein